jgi:hypothetical protein
VAFISNPDCSFLSHLRLVYCVHGVMTQPGLMFFFVLSGLIGSVHAAPLDTPSPTPLQKHRSPHYLRLSQSDTSCWRLNKGSAKMDKFHWSTTLCAVLLFSGRVQIAYATPPPPEGRACQGYRTIPGFLWPYSP